jgi:hypothetical protein
MSAKFNFCYQQKCHYRIRLKLIVDNDGNLVCSIRKLPLRPAYSVFTPYTCLHLNKLPSLQKLMLKRKIQNDNSK